MSVNDLLNDRQSESGTFFIFSSGKIRLVEPVKYLFQVFFGNTDTRILYRYEYGLILFACLYL